MDARDLTPRNWFKRKQFPVKKEESPLWGGFNRDIERMFEDFAGEFGNFETFLPRLFRETAGANLKAVPRTDFSETDKGYIVEVDLPGVKKDDLDMAISRDGVLTIRGKRESREEHKERNYYKLERSFGAFERSVALPDDADTDNVKATFEDGTLNVEIPKKAPVAGEVRKIELSNK